MMKLFSLFTILCLALPSQANHGFHSVTDKIVPEAVRKASQGVYRIKFPILPPFDPTSKDGADSLTGMEKDLEEYDQFVKDLLGPQLKNCRDNPKKLCTIYDRGTAFLVGDGNSLWTAFHIGDVFLSAMSQAQNINIDDGLTKEEFAKIQKIKFPVELFDSAGNRVFGGNENDYATYEILSPFFFEGVGVKIIQNFLDYTKFKLSRPIKNAKPLGFAPQENEYTDTVYLVGFPRATNDRKTINQPDSDGESMHVSIGQVLSPQEAYRRWGLDYEAQSISAKVFTYQAELHFYSDCVDGNSGSPVLNLKGQVVGLFNSSTPKDNHKVNFNRSCFAVRSGFLKRGTLVDVKE